MKFERKTLPDQHYIYVNRECDFDGPAIAKAMVSAFARILEFLSKNEITPLSMPMTVYQGMGPKRLRFQGGILVAKDDAQKVKQDVHAGVLAAGDAMFTTHVGPYAQLNISHNAMWEHMQDQGMTGTFPIWEIYIDDPDEVDAKNLRTEIYRAIA